MADRQVSLLCSTENLLPLVFSKPEIWDQTHMNYTNKAIKFKAWNYIGEKLGVKSDVAKARWTNLRDLFRRELKKTLKATEEPGGRPYKPRWKHFKSMMFLKDQIVKDEGANTSFQFDDSFSLYPETILEDGEGKYDEEGGYLDVDSNHSPTQSHTEVVIVPETTTSRKRRDDDDIQPYKRQRWDTNLEPSEAQVSEFVDYSAGARTFTEPDEDYHFVMSVLPAIRRINPSRKMTFKLKVMQLILDEEKLDKPESD